jgi:hypothetical protein
MNHLKFRQQLVKGLIPSHKENTEICDMPNSSEIQMSQLEVKHSLHWLAKVKCNVVVHVK